MNKVLTNFHFVLLFVGYPLVTSLFLPLSSDIEGISQAVTVPYRAFSLLISLSVIFLNIKRRAKVPFQLKILYFYWMILVFRLFYDFHIRTDVFVFENEKIQVWLYVICICLIPLYAVVKSYRYLDFDKSFKVVFVLTLLSLVLNAISNQMFSTPAMQRMSGNIGLETISFGHLGVSGLLLTLFYLCRSNGVFLKYLISTIFILLSGITVLTSGSRGSILALACVLFVVVLSYSKHIERNVCILVFLNILFVIFLDKILIVINYVSPVMLSRLQLENPLQSRYGLYSKAINSFIDSPIVGKNFAIYHGDGTFIYAHNIILDSFMGMGMIGGFSILFILCSALFFSFKLLRLKNSFVWVLLIFIQQMSYNMVSGSLYYNPLLLALLAVVFLEYRKYRKGLVTSPVVSGN